MSRYRTGPILIATGVAAAVVLALVGLGAWVLADDDDGDAPSATAEASETPTDSETPAGSETPSSSETGSATPAPGSATPSPSASASATPDDGITEWTVAAPAALPQDTVIYVEKGCYNCDGPTSAIERTSSIGNPDALVVETRTLFEAPGDANRYISSWWMSPRGTDIWVMVCSRGYCGSVAQPSADAQETLHHSDDGGITWTEVETFDGQMGIVHVSDGIPVLVRSGVSESNYFTLQGEDIEGPAGASLLVRNNSEELIWQSEDGKSLLHTDGSTVFSDERAFIVRGAGHPNGDTFLITWRGQPAGGQSEYGHVLAAEVAGSFTGRNAAGAPLIVQAGAWMSEDAALGNSQLGPGDVPGLAFEVGAMIPVAIDFKTGALTPLTIYGPEFGEAYRGRNFLSAVDKGPTGIETPYVVDTGGECLNMREGPASASPVVRCWADGVILWAPGKEPTQADGISWIPVYGPDGSDGWASAEFLKR